MKKCINAVIYLLKIVFYPFIFLFNYVNDKIETAIHRKRFLNSDGCDKELRKKLIELYDKNGINLTVLEPGYFDGGIIRYGEEKDGFVIVYDYDKTIESLANGFKIWNKDKNDYTDSYARTDAMEWIEVNIIRYIPYMGINRPKIVMINEDEQEELITA